MLAAVVALGRGMPRAVRAGGAVAALKVVVGAAGGAGRLLRDADTEIAGSGALGVASAVLLAIGVAGVRLLRRRRARTFTHAVLPTTALACRWPSCWSRSC